MILYFSGTGNSRRVAYGLAERLGEAEPTAIAGLTADLPESEPLIWVFPVYGWRVPDIVLDAISRYGGGGRQAVMVATCGDDIGLTAGQWRSAVEAAGGEPLGAYSVRMPNTYVFLPGFDVDTPEIERSKLEAMPARVAEIAESIKAGYRADDVTEGAFPSLKSGLLGGVFHRFMMSAGGYRADAGLCNGCGHCKTACPTHNIEIEDSRPKWGDNCAFCTACYHACPRHAISHGPFSRGKGQYRPQQRNNNSRNGKS